MMKRHMRSTLEITRSQQLGARTEFSAAVAGSTHPGTAGWPSAAVAARRGGAPITDFELFCFQVSKVNPAG